MSDDKTLSDVLLLLTKVSGKLGDRVEKLEKLIGNAKKEKKADDKQTASKKDNKQDDSVSALTKMLRLKFDGEQKKPEQIVEEKQEVIISSFGRDATKTLMQAFGGRMVKERPQKKKVEKPDEESVFSKVAKYLPAIGIALGALGGVISALISGKFGKMWEKIQKGDFEGAFEDALDAIYTTFRPIIRSLPIIGPILSIMDGVEKLNNGNVIGGLNDFVQGVLGLMPLPMPAKAAIMGVLDVLTTKAEQEFGTEQIPKGSGKDIMAAMLKGVGLLAKTGMKFFKRIPIVGSLFSFYEAYTDFQTGSPEGITKGIFNLASGIANLFPGVGTAIGIGLDILSAFIFEEKDQVIDGKKVKKISVRDFAGKIGTFLSELPVISTFYNIGEAIGNFINGDTKEGFISLAKAIPGGQFLIDLYNYQKEGVEKSLGLEDFKVSSFINIVAESIMKAVISTLPKTFGIRYSAAKLFGIKDLVGMPTPEDEMKRLGLTEKQYKVKLEADKKEDEEDKKQDSNRTAGTNAMYGMGYKANDFIKTSDGKLIIPHKDDTLIGMKTDGPLDKFFKNNMKSTEEGNTILKKYAEVSSNILEKQLRLLDDNNKLLNDLVKNMSTPTNVISKPTVITNNFSSNNSLRSLQGVPA